MSTSNELNEMAKRHSAGATINHASPFSHLPSHKNEFELPESFITKWCVPFYMEIGNVYDTGWVDNIKSVKGSISPEICSALLGEFNWRPRLVGAYFTAVKGYEELIDVIGVHLIKSELCCVGFTYALVLAFFNNQKAIQYLRTYLDYYLTTVLPFDQRYIAEAVLYLDKKNETDLFDEYWDKWDTFLEKKKIHEINQALAMTSMLKETADIDNSEMIVKMKEKVEEKLSIENLAAKISILTELRSY